MRLVVVSHKVCWQSHEAAHDYLTDGGFPRQIAALSELFDETRVVVPCEKAGQSKGLSPLEGRDLQVVPLSTPKGKNWRRKLQFPFWILRNSRTIWREIRGADAVHAPIPGDVGTIGLLLALLLRKPLFVRYCGNWLVQRTLAEKFWRRVMELFAGGRNVMLATGGSEFAPSAKNKNIEWIFATALDASQICRNGRHSFPADGKLRLIVASRQEPNKGGATVIESLPLILRKFPNATLDIVGDGSLLEKMKTLADELELRNEITFHGKVTPARVLELMREAHVFCYPTSASEGFPKVVLEALACGLPVATTRVSVLPQLITKDCGVLLDKPTAEKLALAVDQICGDAQIYEQMSSAAQNAARDYSLENWRDIIGEKLRCAWMVSSLSDSKSRGPAPLRMAYKTK